MTKEDLKELLRQTRELEKEICGRFKKCGQSGCPFAMDAYNCALSGFENGIEEMENLIKT